MRITDMITQDKSTFRYFKILQQLLPTTFIENVRDTNENLNFGIRVLKIIMCKS